MKSVFPATYSTLCPTALSSLISARYGTGNVACKLLIRGVGDSYLVESTVTRYIMRIYRSSHRTLAQITEEVRLLLALKEAAVSVSYPILDLSGASVQELEALEGKRYAVLFSYAPGFTSSIFNHNQLGNLGREMGRYHQVSSTISLGGARWNFDLDTTLFKPLEILEPAFSELPEEYVWLQDQAQLVKNKLSQLNTSVFSKGYCHFDFLPKNFHFDGDAVTFFDFDFMGYGWLVNDIMTFWQHLALNVYTGRLTQEAADDAYILFLNAYREERTITQQELALVPYLGLGFWLFYMGFHTTHDQFYAFLQTNHLKGVMGFLRNMINTYWHKGTNSKLYI